VAKTKLIKVNDTVQQIPKIIHYCWFGNKPLDALSLRCIDTWKEFAGTYVLKKWDEESFDINTAPSFVKTAAASGKWAFVSDYVRAWALFNEGGIYLDTDVELKKNIDQFLNHAAFSGFEKQGSPFTALWGSSAGHSWPRLVLDYYKDNDFNTVPNTSIVTDILVEHFGADPCNDQLQQLKEGVVIYPSNYFCVDLPVNFACHHFNGSWTKDTKGKNLLPFTDQVRFNYYQQEAIRIRGQKELAKSISLWVLLTEIPKRMLRPLTRKINMKKYNR
jgi:hypothetical protein